ncbi:MAG: hypothetical protein ACXQTI_01305 [Candidatus Nezhaarchaeales archaeon]
MIEEAYINVWDCRATLVVNGRTEDDLDLTEEQKKALEELKMYVIYTVNGGAINWSGIYHFDEYSLDCLKKLLKGDLSWLKTLGEPTDKDFEETAKAVLEELKKGGTEFVYWNPNERGLTGFPAVLTAHEGKLCKCYVVWRERPNRWGQLQLVAEDVYKPVSDQEALKLIKERLEDLAIRENWTKKELEDIAEYPELVLNPSE